MSRILTVSLLSLASCLTIFTCARAGDVMENIKIGFWRNVCWPKPFVYPDRKSALAPMAIMANNGWRRNNLLGSHHFNEENNTLTTAGELKVRWILTQAPVQRRNIFVERGHTPERTGKRIEAVQQYASTSYLNNTPVNVFDTHLVSEGRSAEDVDTTNVRFRESARPPILPTASSDSSGE